MCTLLHSPGCRWLWNTCTGDAGTESASTAEWGGGQRCRHLGDSRGRGLSDWWGSDSSWWSWPPPGTSLWPCAKRRTLTRQTDMNDLKDWLIYWCFMPCCQYFSHILIMNELRSRLFSTDRQTDKNQVSDARTTTQKQVKVHRQTETMQLTL